MGGNNRARWFRNVSFLLRLASALVFLLVLAGTSRAATFSVNSTADAVDANPGNGVCATAGGVCTLRAAIQEANILGGGPHTINVPAGTYTLTIAGTGENSAARGDLDINAGMTISGAGAGSTIIQAGTNPTNGIDRVFDVDPAATGGFTVGMSNMTIQYGRETGTGGGGILNQGTLSFTDGAVTSCTGKVGGGIASLDPSSLTLTRVTVAGNTSTSQGGGIYTLGDYQFTDVAVTGNTAANNGGGIFSDKGSGTISSVTISGNQANNNKGGGIYSKGSSEIMTLVNVTVSGNSASSEGGGVCVDGNTSNLTNVTVFNNTASNGSGIRRRAGALVLRNTIVAGNAAGNCSGMSSSYSAGYNLDDGATCLFTQTGDIQNQNPVLGALADNGGYTWTHALLAGSPAIDNGTNTGAPGTDQRGYVRPVGVAVDIGAYEYGSSLPVAISGTVFEDVNYGGGAGRNRASSSGVVRSGARVEIYNSGGNYVTFATTDASGNYSFAGLVSGNYTVRVVNSSVTSSRTGYVAGLWPVQTFRTNASSGTAAAVTDYVGGEVPSKVDAGNGSTTLAALTTATTTAQSITAVTIGSSDITGVDFGFNFDTIVNTNDAGQGSLRQFLTNANTLSGDASLAQSGLVAGKENAIFMISNGTSAGGLRSSNNYFSGGVATISPTSALPTISTPMVIDAQKQPGWTSAPIVELNGTNAGSGTNGLSVTGGGTTVKGLIVNRFGGAGSGSGIRMQTGGGNTVAGCYIGTNATGTAAAANTQHGVFIVDSPNNVIGGTTPLPSNVISGNAANGVYILGAPATGNSVRGNYIGTNAAGTAALANGGAGVDVEAAGANNTIGGTTAGSTNVISGNVGSGVWLYSSTTGTLVQGNYIGTGASGLAAIPNQVHGVALTGGTTTNTIGGTGAAARNVISGNQNVGVRLATVTTSGNTIQGNYIGVGANGTAALGNGTFGVFVDATNTSVGGTADGAGNVIANNGSDGVAVVNTSTGNGILRNAINANGGLGIDLVDDGVTANDGAKPAGQPNLLMDFPVFTSASLYGTTLTVAGYVGSAPNQATFANARVEIFKSDNDPSGYGEGQTHLGFLTSDANGNVSGAITVSGLVVGDRITGTATDGSNNTSEFGANVTVTSGGVSGTVFEDVNYGGGAGRSLAGSSGVVRFAARVELYDSGGNYVTFATTDASGNYSFTGLMAGNYTVRVVNSTVTSSRTGYVAGLWPVQTFRTDASSGTAAAVTDYVGGEVPSKVDAGNGSTTLAALTTATTTAQSIAPVTIGGDNVTGVDFGFNFDTIVNTNDSDQGSLRQFLTNANALGNGGLAQAGRTAGIESAIFMISNGSSAAGLRSSLNYFSGGVATLSPGTALPTITDPVILDAQTQPGWTSAPILVLAGNAAAGSGLTIAAGSSTVRGFVINGFSAGGAAGIAISGTGGNTIEGNYLGTNATGAAAAANYQGININGTTGNDIGGSSASQRNVISGNTWRGIMLQNGSSGNVLRGNYVGVNASGTAALANNIGVYFNQSPNNTLGGTGAGEGNVLSGNANFGIYLVYPGTSGNVIQGNTVGLNAARTAAVPNGGAGIELCCGAGGGASNNTIGGPAAGAGNFLSGNTGDGIRIWDGTGNTIQGNSIYGNGRDGVRMHAGSGNAILANAIYGNGWIGIDLGSDNVTANNGTKNSGLPNYDMDFPVLTYATLSGTTLTVTGYVGSAPSQSTFANARVEIFQSDNDGSGYGEGQTFLGFLTADASGNISGAFSVSGLAVGDRITGTATDGSNNTSEFGANVTVAAPAYQPDAMIKLAAEGAGAYATDNVYEATAATQVKSQGVVSATTATYHLLFQNDGNVLDSLVITQAAADNCAGFTVQYLDNTSTDRSAAVTGAGYTITGLAAGAGTQWTLLVIPPGSLNGGSPACGISVTATSAGNSTKKDQVRATTSSTSANLTLLKSADRATVAPGQDITYTVIASNGAGLTPASAVVVTEPIPANTGFKVGSATFDPGTSTLSFTVVYSNNNGSSWSYAPASGGCSAPPEYDFCVTDVRWTTTGSMPSGTSFSVGLVVRVK